MRAAALAALVAQASQFRAFQLGFDASAVFLDASTLTLDGVTVTFT